VRMTSEDEVLRVEVLYVVRNTQQSRTASFARSV